MAMYMVGALSGALALLVSTFPVSIAAGAAVLAVVIALLSVALLERAPYERQVRNTATATD